MRSKEDTSKVSKFFAEATNVTSKILAIFEPITLPTDMSDPLITASIETKSSHKEVPKPTTISPIKNSETLIFLLSN